MRATVDTPDKRYEHMGAYIGYAFDNAKDGAEGVGIFGQDKGHPTFWSLIDTAAAHAKGMPGRIRIPDSLIQDYELREHLKRYWGILHSGYAAALDISKSHSAKPQKPNLGLDL